jgi:hypothetical protein
MKSETKFRGRKMETEFFYWKRNENGNIIAFSGGTNVGNGNSVSA